MPFRTLQLLNVFPVGLILFMLYVCYKDVTEDQVKLREIGIHEDGSFQSDSIASSPLLPSSPPIPACSQERRQHAVREFCARESKKSKPQPTSDDLPKVALEHIIVDEVHKVLYCYVPKASCSSWKHLLVASQKNSSRLVAALADTWDLLHNRTWLSREVGLPYLADYSPRDVQTRLAEYRAFLVVRHPLARLYSAYTDKFLYAYDKYAGRRYGQTLPKVFPNAPIINGSTFLDFKTYVDFVQMSFFNWSGVFYKAKHDEHWMRQVTLCEPCKIRYDVIAKVETLERDQEEILSWFGGRSLPQINSRQAERTRNKFGVRPPSLAEALRTLSAESVEALRKIYRQDLEVFGYAFDQTPECSYANDSCC